MGISRQKAHIHVGRPNPHNANIVTSVNLGIRNQLADEYTVLHAKWAVSAMVIVYFKGSLCKSKILLF